MVSSDEEYYRQRMRVERQSALDSGNAEVAEIHAELARAYEALLEHRSLRPTLKMKFPARQLEEA